MIPYTDPNDIIAAGHRDLLITDGTVTVSGTSYSVAGATVTIENNIIEQEAFELHQSLCSESQIRYGACESASISFVIHENIAPLKGKTLKVYMIPDSDASKMLQIGVFKVDEDKLSADRTKRTITAYDAMYDILNADVAAWYNSELPNSSSSITLAIFRSDFLTHFGITAEAATLANDGITLKRTIEPETLSGADVIRAICEINGVFGTITNEGKFRFVELTENLDAGLFPADDLYPSNTLYPQDVNQNVAVLHHSYYTDVQFEDYMSEGITQLVVRTNDEDVGVTVGTSGNTYVITGNFLVYGYNATALTAVANACLAKIKNRYYKPCTVNALGNPLLEVGDGIRVHTTYRGIVTYILGRKLSGIQALRDTYTASGEQKSSEQLNSVTTQFKQLANKTASLKVDVDGVQAYVEEQLDDTIQGSYAYLTEQEIGLKVSKSNIVSDLDDQMSGITITSSSIAIGTTGTFSVDSSNFRLNNVGNLTIRSCTFDVPSSWTGSILTIQNGVITTGNTEISDAKLKISSNELTSSGLTVNQISLNGKILDTNGSGKLTFNGDVVLVADSGSTITCGNLDAASSVTVGSVFGTYYTFINDQSIQTEKVQCNNFQMGIRSGQWQQLTIGGSTYWVMTGT